MLFKGSGEHVPWSPDSGGSDHLRRGGGPVRWVHGWHCRGKPPARSGTYWGAGVGGHWSLLGSLRTRRLATLMDRLRPFSRVGFRGVRDGERRGSGELPEDNSSSACNSTSSDATTS